MNTCSYIAIDPDMALKSSMRWDFTMTSVGRAGYSHQTVPLHTCISSSSYFFIVQTSQLLFLLHISTTYLDTVVAPAVDMSSLMISRVTYCS